ncbi:helix-turn-helix domain-containing protein [Devosia sp.]|uniref:helix-turn-helix domain-containing protein n=1 Tax=Devosia sp. TaxID=1871048 RepID=UPI002734DDE4|nr:helix-turn-helix domain-containing protein [Devosia sp.]MDP2782252.1 helix-turn-helix domain-containing protein [Devosia sp.]
MDKRLKPSDKEFERKLVDEFFQKFGEGQFGIPSATKAMRRISRLTQPEFAKHRGISLATLRKIETGSGSANVETLNKIGDIFGLEIGFLKKAKKKF